MVKPGDKIVVDRLEAEAGTTLTVSDVLLVGIETAATVGSPLVTGATVTLQVEEHGKGEKIRVFKYKSKSRYRKTRGHRQYQTTLTVSAVTA